MKVTLEIKETNINIVNNYIAESYSGNGIYLNTDENGVKAYYLVSGSLVMFLGNYEQLIDAFNSVPEVQELELLEAPDLIENVVSESFALKAIAIAIRGDMVNFKDIE